MPQGKLEGRGGPRGDGDHVQPVNPKLIEQRRERIRLGRHGGARRHARAQVAEPRRGDDPAASSQPSQVKQRLVAAAEKPVDCQHRLAAAAFGVLDHAEPGHHRGAIHGGQACARRITVKLVTAGQALTRDRRSAHERGENHVLFHGGPPSAGATVAALLIIALTLTQGGAAATARRGTSALVTIGPTGPVGRNSALT
jgi:hypothetical protein